MPSRCDSEDSFHLLTSDLHPRLLHAVALRLKGGRHQVVGGTCAKSSSCSCSECQPRPLISDLRTQFSAEKSPRLRLNCEAMPCNNLGQQSEELIHRRRLSCEATACVPPMSDHNNSDQRCKHERSANQHVELGDGHSGQVESCRPVGVWGGVKQCFPWADAHGYILSPLRG
jgi:hypothetical protein